jgi:GTP-binding protein
MKILSAEFLISATVPGQYPRQPLPEVAFAGRSNVGKSSLINTLLHRKGLARTSATPGKTQAITFFLINQRFFLVDLPGYGYAKVPQAVQASWQPMVETYLQQRDTLRAVVHIVDLRHPPTVQDQQLREWLQHQRIGIVVVATKADKVKPNQRAEHTRMVRQRLALPVDEPLFLFSSHNREGRLALLKHLASLMTPVVRQRGLPSQSSA